MNSDVTIKSTRDWTQIEAEVSVDLWKPSEYRIKHVRLAVDNFMAHLADIKAAE